LRSCEDSCLVDYGKTLNLPQTDFPMKAGLPLREPQLLKFWEEQKVADLIRAKSKGKPKRILHDGPPYSNGRIHLGQAFNKILKDIVVKFWTLSGYDSPYVPGWDTHGLPNELEAIKTFKLNRKAIEPIELRRKCRESALHYVDVQREQFERLGIGGEWQHPYLTLDPTYEAKIVETFGVMADQGYIYRGLKSVYWCTTCETSLAEAEIEYKDKQSHSIYVKFELQPGHLLDHLKEAVKIGLENFKKNPALEGSRERFERAYSTLQTKNPYVLIWTTTPWTLPANVAIALHPDEEYVLVLASNGELYFLAGKLIASVEKATGLKFEVLVGLKGSDAAVDSYAKHPFLDRKSVLITQDYVTMEDGTGAVHTAPGHGQEDFAAAQIYHLPIIVPVNAQGFLTEEAGPFAGLHVQKDASQKIIDYLHEHKFLLAAGTIQHSYPHCWRCHNPVIFRATEQWFVGVDHQDLRKRAIEAVHSVAWYPSWGEERMQNTITQRPDWCISRQRTWGVPIPAFYCEKCEKPITTKESIQAVKTLFQKEGADSWYIRPWNEILPKDFACPHCGSKNGFRKEMDIFDVWFESGVSHLAVLETRPELDWPAQLYLEGPDQYRGWFQVSLLSAMAVKGKSPYKQVLTHGWTLDLEGRAMHKSLGNAIDPMDVLKDHGADILRLLFASVEFKNDVRLGDKSLKDVGEAYRKIRNTCRFLIGNLYDFHPVKNKVPYDKMIETDRWALSRLADLMDKVTKFYENYDFHLVYYHVLNFCVVDMSAIYLDVLKDRLYTWEADSVDRRSAQTALHQILLALVKMLSPILSFTAEDLWQALPPEFKESASVQLTSWPVAESQWSGDDAFKARWNVILEIKNQVYAQIEELRKEKTIKQALEAEVELGLPEKEYEMFKNNAEMIREFFVVSQLVLKKAPERTVKAQKFAGQKCVRCWKYFDKLSTQEPHVGLCDRCLSVVSKIIPV